MITEATNAQPAGSTPDADASPPRPDLARAGPVGLLLVQILIGYEWLISGLTKVIDGGFRRLAFSPPRTLPGSCPGCT